ncbi:MAG: hypothetical protein NC225_05070 [Clostridium sp.]|nr:hypothetical protein [Clostridium sp.]MCM1398837.1 hypothetical protein [Clostridium sp.]MCM1458532.1 hypothetical protein [Bacteroides sp.]
MKYLDLLSSEEIQYICTSIPHCDIIKYFKKNPKEFTKIRPGFRPATVTPKDATKLLTSNISRNFVSSFVEKIIERWLLQIQDAYERYLDEEKSETAAIVHTLSQSYFSDNVVAYFKLTDKDYSDEQISLISDMVYDYKITKQQIEDLNESIQKLKTTIQNMESETKKKDLETKKIQKKLQQALKELELFQGISLDLERCKDKVITLEVQKKQQKKRIDELLLQKNEIIKEKEALESDIVLRIENERKRKLNSGVREFSLLRPNDMKEFQENLSYIFEDLGIGGSVPGIALLNKYLANVLFCGIPIIISEQSGLTLAMCVANALIGTQEISLLRYTPDVTEEDILNFLSESKRVILLDNFIGNYNETLLLPIVRMYGDKIIFMTIPYDRTLNYISSEFLKYCSYINVSHFNQFTAQVKINEDPLTVTEEIYSMEISNKRSRHLRVLNEILVELSLEYLSTSVELHGISNDDDISAELIYNILPYCTYVCNKQPMRLSEKLQKYMGRCSYNKLIGEWFTNE